MHRTFSMLCDLTFDMIIFSKSLSPPYPNVLSLLPRLAVHYPKPCILPYQTFLFFWQDLTAPLQQKYHSHHLQILQYFWFSPNSWQNLLLVLQNFALSPKKLQPSLQNFAGIPNKNPLPLKNRPFLPQILYVHSIHYIHFPQEYCNLPS